jgi:integrase/recombinase XerD
MKPRRKPPHQGYQTARHIRHRAKDQRGGQPPGWEPAGEPGTLEGEFRRYLEHLEVRNYSSSTINGTRQKVRDFITWAAARELTDPKEITMAVLEAYQREIHRHRKTNGKPLTATTQRSYISIIKLFFGWMTKRRIIAANPASELDLPRPEKRLHEEALAIGEIDTVLNIPDISDPLGLRNRTMLEVFYSTGLRRSELTRLETTDINHERGTLRVRQGKGKKDRVVPIGQSALEWIARYLDQARPRLAVGPSAILFLTSYGEGFNPDTLSRLVSDLLKKANIGRPGSCHLIRHTCATHMLEGGADIRYIQQLLGHESLETTAIYTETSITQLKEIHAQTHPAEKRRPLPERPSQDDADDTPEA